MNNPPSCRVVIAASFTAQPIEPVIDFWARELSLRIDLDFAPYDQIFQQLLGSETAMATNSTGLNVFLLRLEDLARNTATDWSGIRQAAKELARQLRDAARRWSVPVVVVVCPPASHDDLLRDAESDLLLELREDPAVHVLGSAALEAWYPGAGAVDAYADQLGHVPYTSAAFAAIGTAIVRQLYRIRTPEPKVVVVDADNTLWDGVAGEGDLTDIEIGAARQSIQDLLLAQRAAGRLLCLCSRNTEADTVEVIGKHSRMRLGRDDFTAIRVNWRPKSENLRDLAGELNLGLDSFVFIDDSPVECAEVREHCPEVAVIQPPAGAPEAERYLRHCWILDIGNTTEEDTQRTARYQTEVKRAQARQETPSLAEFLDSLDLRVDTEQAGEADVARIAQLTQRTNQFNLCARKSTEPEVRELLATRECFIVSAEDRFGPYGTVGVVVLETAGAALRVETFLLSCRALGRGIEYRVLAHVGRLAQARGLAAVEIRYRKTARNQPAADFLRQVCGVATDTTLADGVFTLPAADAAGAKYVPPRDPGTIRRDTVTTPVPPPATAGQALWRLGDRVCPDLTTAEQIEERIRAGAAPSGFQGDPASLEGAIGVIMAEVLGRDSVGPDDNFFELGGTSIHLVQFMSAIRTRLGVELPMDTLYNSELTVHDVGLSILLCAMGEPGDVSEALALVESMTDDQVESMLASLESSHGRHND